jgi:lambda family phage portal protein
VPSDVPLIDRIVAYFSPEAGARRAYYRAAAPAVHASYRGAVHTRLDTTFTSAGYQGTRTRETIYGTTYRTMRDRARQLERDNVLAAAALDRAVENVIGTGIRVRATSSDPTFNAAANAQWKRWTGGKTADIRHDHTFGELQRKFYRAKLRDGDCGCLLTEEKDADGLQHPRLQIIEGEHIDRPFGGPAAADKNIVDGLELDSKDAATAYWLRTVDADGREEPLRVKARDFIFCRRANLYGSYRGESAFNGSWTLFDQIVGYLEAAVVTSRVGASQALIIRKKNPAQALSALATTTNAAGNQQAKFSVEPGMAHYIGEGEEVTSFNPSQPQQNLPDAIAAFVRFVGLRFGLTIEQLLLDFSRTNYSSARAARLQAEATAYLEQDDFAATFLARVYPWFVSKCVKNGLIAVPAPADAWAFEWIPQGRPWVDPTKEIDAAEKAINLGLETRSNVAMERGYDFAELVARNKQDRAMLAAAGLPVDPSKPAEAAPPPTTPTLTRPTLPAPRAADEQEGMTDAA